jgi:UDP-N-acetylglucosamine diphosphorylase / glucose-1-phosphate thymidylyltransferase / UDP-N-acetylgalactosamine diphosphorylase / glucosamine-1-phosphate N-acetyltransferase / galactosamine-1-phosphate N-acetyltransferase
MINWLHHTYQNELFFPFTQLEQLHKIKIGRYTIADRWQKLFKLTNTAEGQVSANCLPSIDLIKHADKHANLPNNADKLFIVYNHSYDIIKHTQALLTADLFYLLKTKKLTTVPDQPNVFVEQNVLIENVFFNTTKGAIYISKGAHIQNGVCLNGPLYIGENTVIKNGATIYGASIIGDNCTIGGEIKNSIIMDYTNKGHYGYLGDSMLGEWCNLGAGTTNSNVKNNASTIKVQLGNYKVTVGNKAGMLMGNFSKTAINTAINTGTVIGVSCNIFSQGLTPKNIPNFSWGVQTEKYIFDKSIIDIQNWMQFKNQKLKNDLVKKLKLIYSGKI